MSSPRACRGWTRIELRSRRVALCWNDCANSPRHVRTSRSSPPLQVARLPRFWSIFLDPGTPSASILCGLTAQSGPSDASPTACRKVGITYRPNSSNAGIRGASTISYTCTCRWWIVGWCTTTPDLPALLRSRGESGIMLLRSCVRWTGVECWRSPMKVSKTSERALMDDVSRAVRRATARAAKESAHTKATSKRVSKPGSTNRLRKAS